MKNEYTEPQIVDYGSIVEMTAGKEFHLNEDALHRVGQPLNINSSGPCYPGIACTP